jgi:regulator of sigma D
MGTTDTFRQQHLELLQLMGEIVPLLDVERLARDCTDVRLKLSTWARKLRVHLTLEDRLIYPRILHHADPLIVSKATRYQKEMRPLDDNVTQYTHQWLSEKSAIQTAASKFAEETKSVFELLSKRFRLEDNDLYMLVDQTGSPSGHMAAHVDGGREE